MPKTYTMMVKKKYEEGKKKVRKEKEIVIDHLYFDH